MVLSDSSTVLPIKRLIHDRHATSPELALELIAISHYDLLARQRIGHRTVSGEGASREYTGAPGPATETGDLTAHGSSPHRTEA
jgi:hypothetical protein